MDLNYASTIVVACCILHNFVIVEADIGGDEIDQVNSKFPMKKDLISIEEKLSKNIAKQQRDILFNM